jgi:hypothetical protein
VDLNSYVIEALSRYQLEELRAEAAVRSHLREAAHPRPPVRVTLGLALIRVGTWVVGSTRHPLARPF